MYGFSPSLNKNFQEFNGSKGKLYGCTQFLNLFLYHQVHSHLQGYTSYMCVQISTYTFRTPTGAVLTSCASSSLNPYILLNVRQQNFYNSKANQESSFDLAPLQDLPTNGRYRYSLSLMLLMSFFLSMHGLLTEESI